MGRPEEWANRVKAVEVSGHQAIPVEPREPTVTDQMKAFSDQDLQRQMIASQLADAEEERARRRSEREAEDDLRRRRRQVEEAKLEKEMRDLRGGGGPSQENAAVSALRDIVTNLNATNRDLLGEVRGLQTQLVGEMTKAQEQRLASMEAQLQMRVANPATAEQPLDSLKGSLSQAREFLDAIQGFQVSIPNANGPADGRFELERLKITEESALRRMDSEARLEEARARRIMEQGNVENRAEQIRGAFSALDKIGGTALGGFLGKQAEHLFGRDDEGVQASAQTAPELQPWNCPHTLENGRICGHQNWSSPEARSAICQGCGLMLLLQAPGEPPPHLQVIEGGERNGTGGFQDT